MRELACLLLLCACAGASDDATDAPIDAAPDAEPAAPAEPVIPLCEGSPPESSALCQQLRYGSHGYCNFWHECGH